MIISNATVVLAQLSTGEAQNWLADNLVPLVLCLVGIGLMVLGAKGEISKSLTAIGGIVIALGVIGLSFFPGGVRSAGEFIAGLFVG